ncbi:MAG: OB-fold domain-containing protein [Pseudomonadota bacterium]
MSLNVYAYKCTECGYLNYPYHMICKKCSKGMYDKFEQVPLPKNGKLVTFTKTFALPADFEVEALSLGIVELENGVKVLGQLDIDEPKMGMKVKGEVKTVREDEFKSNQGFVFYKA